MIDYKEYYVNSVGARAHCICVPCFFGDGDDFYSAARMNRFYESALSKMIEYASAPKIENARRTVYTAIPVISRFDDGKIAVTLQIKMKIVYGDTGRAATRNKSITHLWRGGVIVKK